VYPVEVARLLTYGVAQATANWPNYVEDLGLRAEHEGALIQLLSDPTATGAGAGTPAASAPVHAWRALGQLRCVPAVAPLLEVLERAFDDWSIMEIPEAIGMIGRPALPVLARWIVESRREGVTYGVIRSLVEVARRAPDAREEIVTLLTRRLEKFADEDFVVNAYLVEALCGLGAKEALPLITEVYLRQRSDVTILDWDRVLAALGTAITS
jgi:hypothetical protein